MKLITTLTLLCVIYCSTACRRPARQSAASTKESHAVAIAMPNTSATNGTPEKTAIKVAIFKDWGVPGSEENPKVGAYFVRVDQDEVSFFLDHFNGSHPRVDVSSGGEESFENFVNNGGATYDKRTGRRGIFLGVGKVELKGNRAEVEVFSSEGPLSLLCHSYTLLRTNGNWTVQTSTSKPVS